ncbi:RNA-binding protein 44 [Rhynchocyon petersi]
MEATAVVEAASDKGCCRSGDTLQKVSEVTNTESTLFPSSEFEDSTDHAFLNEIYSNHYSDSRPRNESHIHLNSESKPEMQKQEEVFFDDLEHQGSKTNDLEEIDSVSDDGYKETTEDIKNPDMDEDSQQEYHSAEEQESLSSLFSFDQTEALSASNLEVVGLRNSEFVASHTSNLEDNHVQLGRNSINSLDSVDVCGREDTSRFQTSLTVREYRDVKHEHLSQTVDVSTDFRACFTTSRATSAVPSMVSTSSNTEITMMNKKRPGEWPSEKPRSVACNTDWSFSQDCVAAQAVMKKGPGKAPSTDSLRPSGHFLNKVKAAWCSVGGFGFAKKECMPGEAQLSEETEESFPSLCCQKLMRRALQVELHLLTLHYRMCHRHCSDLYRLVMENKEGASRNLSSNSTKKELGSVLLSVLGDLKARYVSLREKINKGMLLEELPPLSVESKLLSTFSAFVSMDVDCRNCQDISEDWFDAKENLTGVDTSGIKENQIEQDRTLKPEMKSTRTEPLRRDKAYVVHIGGLGPLVSEADLRSLFQKYEISEISIYDSSTNYRCASLAFKESCDAKMAAKEMSGMQASGEPVRIAQRQAKAAGLRGPQVGRTGGLRVAVTLAAAVRLAMPRAAAVHIAVMQRLCCARGCDAAAVRVAVMLAAAVRMAVTLAAAVVRVAVTQLLCAWRCCARGGDAGSRCCARGCDAAAVRVAVTLAAAVVRVAVTLAAAVVRVAVTQLLCAWRCCARGGDAGSRCCARGCDAAAVRVAVTLAAAVRVAVTLAAAVRVAGFEKNCRETESTQLLPDVPTQFIPPNTLNPRSFTKIMKRLAELHPEVSRDHIVEALQEVRLRHQGFLNGLSINTIVEMTSSVLKNPASGQE